MARKPKAQKCAPVVRTHDGGITWEAACACGYRSQLDADKAVAEKAAKEHVG